MSKFIPSNDTIEHFIWRYKYFNEDNNTPLFHYKMVDYYLNDGSSYIKAIKAFRGSAKTTNSCYLALHRIEEKDSYYTLIVSDTMTQAESIVADISSMVRDSNVPYQIIRDVVGELQLRYKGKDYYIVAKGAGSSLRGIKRNRKRPDLIILDDIINDEICQNKLRIDRLNRWFFKALLPSLHPSGSVWAVGTPLSQNDLFMLLCNNYGSLNIPIHHDMKSNWKDRFSDEWIKSKKDEYKNNGMIREWKQEYELILTDDESRIFDVSKIKTIDESSIDANDFTWFITLDGAFSEKDSADYSAFIVNGIDRLGNWFIYPFQMRGVPQNVVDKLFELVQKFNVNIVGIEKGQFLLSMKRDIETKQLDYQQYFSVEELSTSGSKLARIKALSSVINSGLVTIIDTGEPAETLIEQISLVDNISINSTHDDLVDALAQQLQLQHYFSQSEPTDYSDYIDDEPEEMPILYRMR